MGKKSSDDEAIQIFLDWAQDDQQVRQWQRDLKLRKLLGPRPSNMEKAAKGRDSDAMLVQIKGVLPPRIAEGAAAIIARISESKWNTLEWDGDPAKPALDGIRASHRFGAVVDPSSEHGGPELLKALSRLMPPADNRHASFHLGRFEEGDFLATQNDAAFCAVDAGTKDPAKAGQIIKCSRDIGVMLFLSKNRTEAGGGLLRDLYYQHRADHKGMSYVPEFNSLIAYHVPREYEITPVLSDEPLLSVFGWYLQEGELYDLKRPPGPTTDEADESSSKRSKREREKAAKRKLRVKVKREEQLSMIPDWLQALAAEREKAREKKQFSRADAIRAKCLQAGYRFNAGGKLVKVSNTHAKHQSDDAKENSNVHPSQATETVEDKSKGDTKARVEAKGSNKLEAKANKNKIAQGAEVAQVSSTGTGEEGVGKKKKESKAQRLQRQAKEAAATAVSGAAGTSQGIDGIHNKVEDEQDEGADGGKVTGKVEKRKAEKAFDGTSESVGEGGTKKKVTSEDVGDEDAGAANKVRVVDARVGKAVRKQKRGINTDQLLALGGAEGRSDTPGGKGGEKRQDSSNQPEHKEGNETAKRPPKRPKKRKAMEEVTEKVEEQHAKGKGKGREMLLARIKKRGWMRPSQTVP